MRKMNLISVILLLFGLSSHVNANEVKNGGQLVAVQFVSRAWHILDFLQTRQTNLIDEAAVLEFHTILNKTSVIAVDGPIYSTDNLIVDLRVTTLPTGEKVIEIDRQRWNSILASTECYMLIFHEYLRILKLSDDQYQISARLKIDKPPTNDDDQNITPGTYITDEEEYFRITPDLRIVGVKGRVWPFATLVEEMGLRSPRLWYSVEFNFSVEFNESKNAFFARVRQTAKSNHEHSCANWVGTFELRKKLDSELEIQFTSPTSVWNRCREIGTAAKENIIRARFMGP